MLYHQTKFGCKPTSYLENIVKNSHISIICSLGSPSRDGDVTVYICDINQPSLATPVYSVLVSISDFMALSTVFHSINSPDNSPFSHSVLPVLSLPYWSFQLYTCLFMKVFFSPDIIPTGCLGSNILNLRCDLDLERSNPIFPQDTPAYNAVPSNQVWLQTDQKFRRNSKRSHIMII